LTQPLVTLLRPAQPQAGFTLLEAVVVVTIIAVVAAIALPSWLSFLDQRRVNMTQDMIYQALRRTQQEASQNLQPQQFSLRERDDLLEWASHPASVSAVQVAHWTPLIEGVRLASEDNTLPSKDGIHYARFDHMGNTSSLGRITLVGSGGRLSHRCVVVSTLLGAMRKGQGHTRIRDDRYCY
jgi:prepilin-type N-terminal cleavage/methylation domain-containing protein